MGLYKAVIIDDEIWTRETIKKLAKWKENGLEVVGEASDGEYGLELIRHTRPDVILTDVKMPNLDGIQLIRQLRAEQNDALVIFISGYDDYTYIRSALKLDALDYLLKPVKEEELNKMLALCTSRLSKQEHLVMQEEEKGFLQVPWAADFFTKQENLCDALISTDTDVIREKCRDILVLVQKYETGEPSKGTMVCVYYSMMNHLEQFLLNRELKPHDITADKETSFVFSRDLGFVQMMEYLEQLYLLTAEKIHELNRNRGRFNVAPIEKYMQEHFTEAISLEMMAEQFYVSKEYLSKAFKQETGRGFWEYLTSLRMERAKELILDYKIPLKEVGELTGYMDQAHFYKTFKKYHQKTPGEIQSSIIDNK